MAAVQQEQVSPADNTATRDIDISDIHVHVDRMRALRPEKVDEIAASIKELGQLQPILVAVRPAGSGSPRYHLVAGRHRLEAHIKLGSSKIKATIADGLEGNELLLAEIDENLARAELTKGERALHMKKRKELYEKLHPETKQGGDRKSKKKRAKSKSQIENLKSFVEDTAAKTGKGRSTVARDVTRANKLGDVLPKITGTSLDKGDELDELAKLPKDQQHSLADRAVAGEQVSAKDAPAALATKNGDAPASRDGTTTKTKPKTALKCLTNLVTQIDADPVEVAALDPDLIREYLPRLRPWLDQMEQAVTTQEAA